MRKKSFLSKAAALFLAVGITVTGCGIQGQRGSSENGTDAVLADGDASSAERQDNADSNGMGR